MKRQRMNITALKVVLGLILLSIGLTTGCASGCPGFDPSALPLDDAQIKDYGNEVKASKVPVEAIVYGQLGPGGGGGGGGAISLRFDAIMGDLNKIRDLRDHFGFNDAQKNDLAAWAQSIEDDAKAKLSPSLAAAAKSANGAKDLAVNVEPFVKTGGSLALAVADGETKVPDAAKERFRALAGDLVRDFERLYQSAIVLAQGHVQHEAKLELAKVTQSLARLGHDVSSAAIVPVANQDAAVASVTDARNKAESMLDLVRLMTSTQKVARLYSAAKAAFDAAVLGVQNNYINHVIAGHKPQSDTLFLELDNARRVLDRIAIDYPGIEALKSPIGGDAKLIELADKMGTVAVSLGLVDVDRETDINRLATRLSTSNFVTLGRDNSSPLIVDGLASSVVYKMAGKYGLGSIDNVVGPNHHALNEAKQSLNMTDEQFVQYLTSRGKLLREHFSKDDFKNTNVIMAVFADEFGGADVSGMVDELLQNDGRVLLVTSDAAKYKSRAKTFAHGNLDISEGVVLSNAIITEIDDEVNPFVVSEVLNKIWFGLPGDGKTDPTIGNLRPLVLAAWGMIRDKTSPAAIEQGVIAALAAKGVATNLINASGILSEPDVATVQRNIRSNRNYYIDAAKYGDTAARAREAEAQRRSAAALVATAADQAFLRLADQQKNAMNDAVKAAEDAFERKRRSFDHAERTIVYGIARDVQDMRTHIDFMRSNLSACTIKFGNLMTSAINAADYAIMNQDWPALTRIAMAQLDFVTPSALAAKVMRGAPEPTLDASWLSCLVFGDPTRVVLQNQILALYNGILNPAFLDLQNGFSTNLFAATYGGNNGIEKKLQAAVTRFENIRKNLAFDDTNAMGPVTSFLKRFTGVQGKLPGYTNAPATRSIFWSNGPGGAGINGNSVALVVNSPLRDQIGAHSPVLVPAPPPPPPASHNTKAAYLVLNQHHYIAEFLNILGTNDGLAWLSSGISDRTDLITLPNYDITPAGTQLEQEHKFLQPGFATYDENKAFLIKALKNTHQHYDAVVAYSLARVIFKDIIAPLKQEVLAPFWALPTDELKLFQSTGASPAEVARKQIWTYMTELTQLINDMALKLDKPLVAMGDGDAGVGDPANANTSGLMALGQAYQTLRAKIVQLEPEIRAVQPHIATLPAALQAKILRMHELLIPPALAPGLIVKTDLNAHPPWDAAWWGAAHPYEALPAGATLSEEFKAAFEAAYDLHRFNYFKMNKEARIGPVVPPTRQYPDWHAKNQAVVSSPYNLNQARTDAKAAATALGAAAAAGGDADNIVTALTGAAPIILPGVVPPFGGAIAPANSTLGTVMAATTPVLGAATQRAANAAAKTAFSQLKKGNAIRHPLEP